MIPGQDEAGVGAWYTPSQVAGLVGVGQAAILNRLRRGTLRGEKRGGRWRISAEVTEAAVAAYRAQAVSSGSVRLLRSGDRSAGEGWSSTPDAAAEEVMQRLVAAKDEVIATKDRVIEELRQELASQRAAMVVLMGGSPRPWPESTADPGDQDDPARPT